MPRNEKRLTLATLKGLTLLSLFACLCAPSQPTVPTDTCQNPSTGSVDTVRLATPRMVTNSYAFDSAKPDLPPRLLNDGDPLWLVQGGQGSAMVAVRLVLEGSNVPECIAQDTQVMVAGKSVARNRENFTTYPLASGGRVTNILWLPGAFAGGAEVVSDVVGKQPKVVVETLDMSACSGLRLCPCISNDDPRFATGMTDAGQQLWSAWRTCQDVACDGGFDVEQCRSTANQAACATQYKACTDDTL